MKILADILTIIILMGLAACSSGKKTSEASTGCGKSHSAGTIEATLDVDGKTRVYKIIVPENYDPDLTYPLVFGFHGSAFSNTPDTMISLTSSMKSEANEQAIFVYPDERINGTPEHWLEDEEGRDVAFFDALLTELKNNYCVNSVRVFLVGFSDGGGFVNLLACHRSEKITAAAEASGWLPKKDSCGTSSVPFFIWHGRADTISAFDPYAVNEIAHWKDVNGCSATTTDIEPTSEECISYNCSKASLVTCTPNVDHGFPGVIGPSMWKFFKNQ